MLTLFPWQIALLAAGLGGPFGPPPGATLQARHVHTLWAVFFFVAVGVAAIVYGLIFWSIIKYRKRSDELPPQFRENVPPRRIDAALERRETGAGEQRASPG